MFSLTGQHPSTHSSDANHKSRLSPVLLIDQRFPWSPGVWFIARAAHRNSGKHFTYYSYQFIIKLQTQKQPEERDAWGKVCGKGAWSFHALSSHATLPASPHVHQHGSSLNPIFLGGFMKRLLQRHDWLNHWPLVIKFKFSPSPLPGGQEVRLKVPTSNHLAGSTGNQLASLGAVQSHRINITKDTFVTLLA